MFLKFCYFWIKLCQVAGNWQNRGKRKTKTFKSGIFHSEWKWVNPWSSRQKAVSQSYKIHRKWIGKKEASGSQEPSSFS